MKIEFNPIGIIHTPFTDISGMPIQSAAAKGIRGTIEVFPAFVEGLKDLDGFSHIILLYHFHQSREYRLTVTPFLDSQPRGVFATRAPKRPNAIGLSVVKLIGIHENILTIENVDILNQTPLIDIKPYAPAFDHHPADRVGWLEGAKDRIAKLKSDQRFR